MKVLMISVLPPYKAPEADHALHLCKRLAEYGVEMHVIAQKGCVIPLHPRIIVYPVMGKWSWSELPNLVRSTMRCAPDAILLVYIGWIYNYHPMVTFVPTIAKALLPCVPFVTLFEDRYGAHPENTSTVARVIRKGIAQWAGRGDVDYSFGTLLRDSSRLIVVSDRVRAVLAERFPRVNGKSVQIPSPPIIPILSEAGGTARRLKRTTLGLKEDEFLLAYFGHIYPGKGVETLLRAFQIVKGQRRPVRLILVGGNLGSHSYFQEMQAMSKNLGIEDKVIWSGEYAWDSDEASRCLRAADICILPFDNGVCVHNSSLAGASAHGLPIITTEGSVMESLFIHKSNVFLCPAQNPEALAQAIETVMARPELRERLSMGAGELAQEWFSWEKAVERTVEALKADPNSVSH
jgi:glycosyltransferase involved in cell wall biosynthesis